MRCCKEGQRRRRGAGNGDCADRRRAVQQWPGQRPVCDRVGRGRAVRPQRFGPRARSLDRRRVSPDSKRCHEPVGTRSRFRAPCPAGSRFRSRFGKLPFADLFTPAIRYAGEGYAVSPVVAEKWAKAVPILGQVEGFAEHFLPRGRAPTPGEIFSSAAMARSLQKIARQQRRGVLSRRAGGSDGRARPREPGRPHACRFRCASVRLGNAAGARLPWPYDPRAPAQWPGHRGADGARHHREFRSRCGPGRCCRDAASGNRGDEARLRRCLSLRKRPGDDASDSCTVARSRLSLGAGASDRSRPRAGLRPRHAAARRHRLSRRSGRTSA